MPPAREDHALFRPRHVVAPDGNLVGRLSEVETDAEGVVTEVVIDLTPEASESLFGAGMRRGVLTVPAAEIQGDPDPDALRLARNLADLRRAWSAKPAAEAEDDP